ncbi:stage II sporulation protein M, partial [Candidatus Parcubacteria bacterium]|nr:stage II sporulation protein M [Candidatus Parcubacteria bacterium]
LLPHGIFELPAIFLSVALGMKINYQILKKIFTKKVPLFFEIKKALFFFFRFVVFLFFIAAGLEILVSKPISEFLLQ